MTSAKVILSYSWVGNGKKCEEKDYNGNEPLVSELSKIQETIAQIAKKELREDKHTRDQCLKQFRDWILQNRDIENCITGKLREITLNWKAIVDSGLC